MSPQTGSRLLLLLFCAGAIAVGLTTAHPTEDQEDLDTSKPGTCPANVDYPDEGSMLQNTCTTDQDCQDTRKCCYSGGRRQCLLPLDAKEDSCPIFNPLECVTVKPARSECHSDDQCQGTERCCNYWCRMACTPTVPVKPGTCPISLVHCEYPPPTSTCQIDSDCLGNQKCCIPECGLACSDPLP
ncbi:antileukoproteinase-like [Rana temporaria]|uniref:antileukoproteinase-like n=1 Tax=Rana temporaria TaxID=8407 RepID=UPI001AACC01E|nr:antileukoproteinase-like [Rana temporaria]